MPVHLESRLKNHEGISKLHVSGLVYLENLAAQYNNFDSVIVQAPNLRCFTYAEHEDNFHPRENIVLDEIQSEELKKFALLKLKNMEKFTIQAPNILEFDFVGDKMSFSSMDPSSLETAQLVFSSPSSNFGSVDSTIPTTKFLQTKSILIYENPREILIPPNHDVVIFVAPILRVESIIRNLMTYCPSIISILPCTNSKVLQVFSVLQGCAQNQNCGKECPFNTELFHKDRILKEVISCTGTTEGMDSIWYSWLKSTSLINQMTIFMFKWKLEA
ncbi:uncharacterized protein LOC114075329 [Solanum pennellii]|uniref:Uncharacterized protein LOC114075329 n=1 Tax=Solanum pennellii TaxID=28526 RepID=A0ABM1V1J4_SOLPN|nr:uncharacterized protein LOC114075329 [Solanum pennellii]